ncbi:MAG TPA: zf-HC2 domain-containing protein [Vicinamibacterales bacterium]|jgi:tetratricopeptide (TPR) repeat protein
MHQEWTDKLSDYLDDELGADERAAVAAHLATCTHCAQVAADLEKVVTKARTIAPRPPQGDLWPGVHARINRLQPRRFSFTLPQLAAAAVLLIAVSGGAAWTIAQRSTPAPVAAVTPATVEAPQPVVDTPPAPARPMVANVSFADAQYDAAVTDLEKALKTGRTRLDKSTVAIVEHNLQIIDQAIEQARQALEADPANTYLTGHLVEARRRKLDLLRRAAALTNETN